MANTIDEKKPYHSKDNGYRGVLSKYENMSASLYASPDANKRPTQTNDVFTAEDLNNYNMASIRVVPIVDNYSSTNKFLYRDGTLKSNAKTKVTSDYIGFILVQAQEDRTEKYENIPLAGDGFASFFYGANPSVYAYTGIALNTVQDKWRDALDVLYRDYIRGSSAVRNKTTVQLKYDNRIVTGFLIAFSQSISADSQSHSTFQMQIVVTDVTHLNLKSTDSVDLLNSYSREIPIDSALKESGLSNKLLSSDRINSLRDYVRTSFIGVPPAPPKPKAKNTGSSLPNCIVKPPEKDSGYESDTKNATVDSNIAESTCTAIDYRIALNNTVTTIKSKIEEKAKKALEEKDLNKKAVLTNEVKSLNNDLLDKLNEVKQYEDPNSELSKRLGKQAFDETKSTAEVASKKSRGIEIDTINSENKNVTYVLDSDSTSILAEQPTEKLQATAGYLATKRAAVTVLGSDKYVDSNDAEKLENDTVAKVTELEKSLELARSASAKKNRDAQKKMRVAANDDK